MLIIELLFEKMGKLKCFRYQTINIFIYFIYNFVLCIGRWLNILFVCGKNIYKKFIKDVNSLKRKIKNNPIENHKTAAWANTDNTKAISNVLIPKENGINNAKAHVDKNEK